MGSSRKRLLDLRSKNPVIFEELKNKCPKFLMKNRQSCVVIA